MFLCFDRGGRLISQGRFPSRKAALFDHSVVYVEPPSSDPCSSTVRAAVVTNADRTARTTITEDSVCHERHPGVRQAPPSTPRLKSRMLWRKRK